MADKNKRNPLSFQYEPLFVYLKFIGYLLLFIIFLFLVAFFAFEIAL